MKKLIIGFSGLVVFTFFVFMLASAQSTDQEIKKAKTEIVKGCPHSSAQAACPGHSAEKVAPCDPAKCNNAGCDQKNCEGKCKETSTTTKCDQAKCRQQCTGKK